MNNHNHTTPAPYVYTFAAPLKLITVQQEDSHYVARASRRLKVGTGATRELAVAHLVLQYARVRGNRVVSR